MGYIFNAVYTNVYGDRQRVIYTSKTTKIIKGDITLYYRAHYVTDITVGWVAQW